MSLGDRRARIGKPFDGAQVQAGSARSEQFRRDHHVQQIHGIGVERVRQRARPAFDQQPFQPTFGKGVDYRRPRDQAPIVAREHNFDGIGDAVRVGEGAIGVGRATNGVFRDTFAVFFRERR